MSLKPSIIGLTVLSLAACPKSALTQPLAEVPPDSALSVGISDRLQTFLSALSENEGQVQPMSAEIQSFSQSAVTQGMLTRYRSFSDQWWAYVNESNRARLEREPLILPAHPTEDPIFTEMIAPVVRSMGLSSGERRALLEDYRFRTLAGLQTDMEQLFELQLKPIAPNVLRGDPQAQLAFVAFKKDFDALEQRFMLFHYLDFAQILEVEPEQFDEVTTAQEQVVHYSKTLTLPKNLNEAGPLLEDISKKLNEYQTSLNRYDSNSADYDDVLKAIMMLMELQTRLTSMVLDQVSTPNVTGATVIGEDFEIILKAGRTPHGSFDLAVPLSTWEMESTDSGHVYSGKWSKWAEWYSTAFYFLAMRHFDQERAEAVQKKVGTLLCEFNDHVPCVEVSFDPISAWTDSLTFAQGALEVENPIKDLYRLTPTIPPVYLSTGVDFDFPDYPIEPFNITDSDLAFPAYCELVRNPYTTGLDGKSFYDAHGVGDAENWHFPIVFKAFQALEPQKCETTYYDSRRLSHVTEEYNCSDFELPVSESERRWFPRTDATSAELQDLETMTVGFCTAEGAFESQIDATLSFTDRGGARLFASCQLEGCEDQSATQSLPTEFFEQLARETVASAWVSSHQ